MKYFIIKNKSDFDINFLKKISNNLKPYFNLIDLKHYPFKITVINKNGFYDRSYLDIDSGQLILKIDMNKQSPEEISWVLLHEFAHFITINNPELKKACFSKENEILKKILSKKFKLNEDKVQEIFHDFLPVEVFANSFATMIIKKFYKRHPFRNVIKFLRKK